MTKRTSNERGIAWSIASLVLAVCASGTLLIAPIYETGSEEAVQVGTHISHTSQTHNETLLQGGDAGPILFLLLAPIILAATPVLLRHHARVAAVRKVACVIMMLFVLPVGYFTIGVFYFPSVVLMFLAITRGRSVPAADRGEPRHNVAME